MNNKRNIRSWSEHVLNENLNESSDMNFKTEVKGYRNISIYDHAYEEFTDGTLNVEWSWSIDARSWGIKGMAISVKKVSGFLHFETSGGEEIENEFDSEEWEIVTDINTDDIMTADLAPGDIELNFAEKKIQVNF